MYIIPLCLMYFQWNFNGLALKSVWSFKWRAQRANSSLSADDGARRRLWNCAVWLHISSSWHHAIIYRVTKNKNSAFLMVELVVFDRFKPSFYLGFTFVGRKRNTKVKRDRPLSSCWSLSLSPLQHPRWPSFYMYSISTPARGRSSTDWYSFLRNRCYWI